LWFDARMDAPKLLIVKTGQAVPMARAGGRDFEHWFMDGLGPERFDYTTVRVDELERLPPPDQARDFAAVVVTGSPSMVSSRETWSEHTAAWLRLVHELRAPILGVCYGHQLIAHGLGGTVGPNPNGRRMARVALDSVDSDDPLLAPFGPGDAFHVSHFEAVLEPPPGARVIARAPHDPNLALYFGNQTWGVQFHPEFDRATMRAYIKTRADLLADEGQDPDALLAGLDGPTRGPEVLRRFADMALDDERQPAAEGLGA